jgi:hypothetical protein
MSAEEIAKAFCGHYYQVRTQHHGAQHFHDFWRALLALVLDVDGSRLGVSQMANVSAFACSHSSHRNLVTCSLQTFSAGPANLAGLYNDNSMLTFEGAPCKGTKVSRSDQYKSHQF